MAPSVDLTDLDRNIYEWQMWVSDFGEEGQRKLKGSSVLVSRCGGLGSVGCMGAMEAIKLIAGFGTPLTGSLLTFDLREMTFRKIGIKRSPHCPVCGHSI